MVSFRHSSIFSRLHGLLEVTRLVHSEEDLPTVLGDIARTISESLGFRTVVINLYRPEWDDFQVSTVYGSDEAREALLGAERTHEMWGPLLDERFLLRGAYLVPHGQFDWGNRERFVPDTAAPSDPSAWHPEDALFVPMRHSDGYLFGIISVDEPTSGQKPSPDELDVLVAVADHASLAVQGAQEAAQAARHRAALERLLEVSAKLTTSLPIEHVLNAVCEGIRDALGFEKVTLELFASDGDLSDTPASAGFDDGTIGHPRSRYELERLADPRYEVEGCYLLTSEAAQALATPREPHYVSRLNGRGPRAWNHHWLLVPLADRAGKTIGFILADDPSDRLLPRTDQLQALRAFANHAATAIDSAAQFEALRQSNERHGALIAASPLAIMDLDADGLIRTWNEAAEQIFGWTAEEVLGGPNVIVPTERRHEFQDNLSRVMAGESMAGIELWRKRKDGSDIEVSLWAAPLRDADGKAVGVVASMADITTRKAAERTIAESEARKAAILASALDAVITIDHEGKVAEFNPAAEEAFGLPQGDAVGRDFLELVGQPETERPSALARTLETGSGPLLESAVEITARRADGREFAAELALTRVAVPGAPVFTAYLRDITKRKRSEERLREAEAKYRTLVERLPLATYINTLGETIETSYMSPQIEPMLGYAAEDWYVPGFFPQILHPDDRDWVLAEAARVHSTGEPFSGEYRLVGKDGRTVWIDDHTMAVRDDEYRPLFLQGYLIDVTARKESEQALRQSEEMYRLVVENSGDMINLHDLDGRIRYVSPATVAVLGYESAELIGRNMMELVHPDDRKTVASVMTKGDPSITVEVRIRDKSGRWRLIESGATAVGDDAGTPTGILVIGRDVTESRHLEDQLRQSQKLEAVGSLAGGIAHDFNNVLTAVGGYSDLMLQELREDDPLRARAEEIKKAAERATSLTSQLLAFSRHQLLQPKVLDLNAVVEGIESMLRRVIGENIELISLPGTALGRVQADPGQIEQVLVNLAVNARDAMPGGGTLTIETADVTTPDGAFVALTVRDSGVGMDPDTRARAVEPFFTTKGTEGTGLGLSTVYGIVKQSGGDLEIESELGRGTTFRVLLPRAEQPLTVVPAAPPHTEAETRGTERILLVEDEDAVRAVVSELLELKGYSVVAVESAEAALRVGGDVPVDLLMTDVVMPGLDGFQLAERLTARRPGLRVLFTSGYTDEDAGADGLAADAAFLQKPFTQEQLALHVREILDRPVTPARARTA